ncbi:MAG: class I SAM-dependent RNA methyltransferase, partial [Coriobacteriia bacterium]|nr:class I SAM-dependent RNA methyltransferase [Coriobacteriia bacterium]
MNLTIESLAYGGAGVAHAEDGVTVFVDGACPGDVVSATITEDHGRFRKGAIESIIAASPDRVTPRCPYFGECGGCQWQHVDYGAQLKWKRQSVQDALTRIGKFEIPVRDTLGSLHSYGYRNKIELSATATPKGTAFGYARAGSTDILPIERCALLPKKLERAPRALGGALRYLSSQNDTPVERLGIRVSTSGNIEVDLWTAPGPFPRQLAAKIITDAVGARTITRILFKGELKARNISKVEVLRGPGVWEERLDEFR